MQRVVWELLVFGACLVAYVADASTVTRPQLAIGDVEFVVQLAIPKDAPNHVTRFSCLLRSSKGIEMRSHFLLQVVKGFSARS